MRILLVEPNLDDNGAVRVTLERAALWRAAGADAQVFAVAHSPEVSQAAVPDGVPVIHGWRRPLHGQVNLAAALAHATRLARRVDVISSGRLDGSGMILAGLVARAAKKPFAVHVQSAPGPSLASQRYRRTAERSLREAAAVVAVSTAMADELADLGVPRHRLHVVTNGIDVDGVRRAATAEPEVALPDGPLVVGCGRLHPQKAFDVLIRAHALARADGAPAHHLVILGEGASRSELERLAADLGVADSVHLVGKVANPHAVTARAAVFALSSRVEGYPLVLVEALCAGVPVIATDCATGPREILDDGRFGDLVPSEEPAALAEALTRHLLTPDRLRAVARDAAAVAHARFDHAAAARQHLAALASAATGLLPRQRPGRGSSSDVGRGLPVI